MSLTIKHCRPGGEERLYPVQPGTEVLYYPHGFCVHPDGTREPEHMWFSMESPDGGEERRSCLRGGRAYVMNETGATIGTYWLGGMVPPPTEPPPGMNAADQVK